MTREGYFGIDGWDGGKANCMPGKIQSGPVMCRARRVSP
jgi:hypothetical protein